MCNRIAHERKRINKNELLFLNKCLKLDIYCDDKKKSL